MQRQYREFRDKLPADALLFFRLGDFYEVFGRDAEVASRVLGITLTKRHDQAMAGIPHHAAPTYVQKQASRSRSATKWSNPCQANLSVVH